MPGLVQVVDIQVQVGVDLGAVDTLHRCPEGSHGGFLGIGLDVVQEKLILYRERGHVPARVAEMEGSAVMVAVHLITCLGDQLFPKQLLDKSEGLLGMGCVSVDGGIHGHSRCDTPLRVGNGIHVVRCLLVGQVHPVAPAGSKPAQPCCGTGVLFILIGGKRFSLFDGGLQGLRGHQQVLALIIRQKAQTVGEHAQRTVGEQPFQRLLIALQQLVQGGEGVIRIL